MILTLLLLLVALSLGISVYSGAPFLPSRDATVDKIVSTLRTRKPRLVADLGAGNGKIIVELAKAGITAHGYEINPWLVLWGKILIRKSGMQGKAFMHWGNFWRTDFSKYDAIVVFGIDSIMQKLGRKLEKELEPSTIVISNLFKFPNWQGRKDSPLHVYERQKREEGT